MMTIGDLILYLFVAFAIGHLIQTSWLLSIIQRPQFLYELVVKLQSCSFCQGFHGGYLAFIFFPQLVISQLSYSLIGICTGLGLALGLSLASASFRYIVESVLLLIEAKLAEAAKHE